MSKYSIQDSEDDGSESSFESAFTSVHPQSRWAGVGREEYQRRSPCRTEQDGRRVGSNEEQRMQLHVGYHHLEFSNQPPEYRVHEETVAHRHRKYRALRDEDVSDEDHEGSTGLENRLYHVDRADFRPKCNDRPETRLYYRPSDHDARSWNERQSSDLDCTERPESGYEDRHNDRQKYETELDDSERPIARSWYRSRPSTGLYSNDESSGEGSHVGEISDAGSGRKVPDSEVRNRGRCDVDSDFNERPYRRVHDGEEPVLRSPYRESCDKISFGRERSDVKSRPPDQRSDCDERSSLKAYARIPDTKSDKSKKSFTQSDYQEGPDTCSNFGDRPDSKASDNREPESGPEYSDSDAPEMDFRERHVVKSDYRKRNDTRLKQDVADRDLSEGNYTKSDHNKKPALKSDYHSRPVSGVELDTRSNSSRHCLRPDYRERDAPDMDHRERHYKSNHRDKSDKMSDHGDDERDAPDMDCRGKYDMESSFRNRSDRMSDHGDDFDSRSKCSRKPDLTLDYKARDASDLNHRGKHDVKSNFRNRGDRMSDHGDDLDTRSNCSKRPASGPDYKERNTPDMDCRGKHDMKSSFRNRSDRMSDHGDDFDSRSNCSRKPDLTPDYKARDSPDLDRKGKLDMKSSFRNRRNGMSDHGDDSDSKSNCSKRFDLGPDYKERDAPASDRRVKHDMKSSYRERNDRMSDHGDEFDSNSYWRSGSRPYYKEGDDLDMDGRGKHDGKSSCRDRSDKMSYYGGEFDSRSNRSRRPDSRPDRREGDISDMYHRGELDMKTSYRVRSDRMSDRGDEFDLRSDRSRKPDLRSHCRERDAPDMNLKEKQDMKLRYRERNNKMSGHDDDFLSKSNCNRRPYSRPDYIEQDDAETGFKERCSMKRDDRPESVSGYPRGSNSRSDYGDEGDARSNYHRRPDSEPDFRERGTPETDSRRSGIKPCHGGRRDTKLDVKDISDNAGLGYIWKPDASSDYNRTSDSGPVYRDQGASEVELKERHNKKPDCRRSSSGSGYQNRYDTGPVHSRRSSSEDFRGKPDPKLVGREKLNKEPHDTNINHSERLESRSTHASERADLRSRGMDGAEAWPHHGDRHYPSSYSRKMPNEELDNNERPSGRLDHRTVDTGLGYSERCNTKSDEQVGFSETYRDIPNINSEYGVQPDLEFINRGRQNWMAYYMQEDILGNGIMRQSDENEIIDSIVKALAKFQGQWSAVVSLSRLVQRSTREVEEVVKKNSKIFGHVPNKNGNDILVELCPKLSICENFLQFSGCRDSEKCLKLHICKFFVLDTCGKGAVCSYGHRWMTGHNSRVLTHFHIQNVEPVILQELIRKSMKAYLVPKICSFYNGPGCKKEDTECNNLHICHAYAYTNQDCKDTCQLNHDIFARHCVRLLRKYGISTNESSRHILQKLNPGLPPRKKETFRKLVRPDNHGSGKLSKRKSNVDLNNDANETSSASDETDDDGKESKQEKKTNTKGVKKGSKIRTFHSDDLCGDITIPEICRFHLGNKCLKEETGCLRLHSKNSFHWQVGINNSWYNLRDFQCAVLETAYTDVSRDGVVLHYRDPKKMDKTTNALFSILGTSDLHVDFETMTMKSQLSSNMNLRRLTSSSKAGADLFHEWFFYDDKNWIKYGTVDSHGRTDLVSTLTSDDLEKQYLKDKNQVVNFKNQMFDYEINFKDMKQKNLATKKERRIRRRPKIVRV